MAISTTGVWLDKETGEIVWRALARPPTRRTGPRGRAHRTGVHRPPRGKREGGDRRPGRHRPTVEEGVAKG